MLPKLNIHTLLLQLECSNFLSFVHATLAGVFQILIVLRCTSLLRSLPQTCR